MRLCHLFRLHVADQLRGDGLLQPAEIQAHRRLDAEHHLLLSEGHVHVDDQPG